MDIPILSWLERLPRYLLHLPGFQNIFHINYHLKKFNILYHSKKIKYQCKELAENFDLVKDVHEISPEDKKTVENELEKVHIQSKILKGTEKKKNTTHFSFGIQLFRALPDITSGLEVRQIFIVRTVLNQDIFLPRRWTFNTFENRKKI